MRLFTLLYSATVHAVLLGAAFAAHVMASVELPPPQPHRYASTRVVRLTADAPQPRDAPPPRPRPRGHAHVPIGTATPAEAPSGIQPEPAVEPFAAPLPGDGQNGGAPEAVLPVPEPPTPVAVEPPPAPVRVGGSIAAPAKIVSVAPEYPAIARAARISGVVILEATIGEDGRVRDVHVLRSIPLLDQAAIDAVRQWLFTPTLLNGQPVPVVMTVTVDFALR